jgi:acyl-CoA synthetase (AMP-forming)/AMP-acid ligase II
LILVNKATIPFPVQVDAETKKEITFAEILDKSRKLSEGLIARGVTYGDVVAICSENNLEYCWIVLGVLRAHASCALLSPTYTTSKFEFYIMGILM